MRGKIAGVIDAQHSDIANPGLILQRYFDRPAKDADKPVRRRALLDAAMHAASSEALRAVYVTAFARRAAAISAESAHRSWQLSTTPQASRLMLGLGAASVMETGLTLHHTYGVPIIPGSGLKGLAAHYCHDIWGRRGDPAAGEEDLRFRRDGTYYRLLFGCIEDSGLITFHDAWILPASLAQRALLPDVLAPHHRDWQTADAPPSDFDNPEPVSFLSVAGTFDFHLSWSGPTEVDSAQQQAWTVLAATLLSEALAEWGAGGKTSSGYGRFAAPPKAPKPKPGEKVRARLLAERTRKGGWRAEHEPSGLTGPIVNTADVPTDRSPGDVLDLIVATATDFRYPSPAEEARRQGPQQRDAARPKENHRRR